MKISLNWLRELVELPPTTEALVGLLTLAGVEVEGVETRGCAIPNVIVAQIKESVQHPNADRLSVCQVDDGTGTARQIVCGAKNYKVGDKVPLALPGAKLGPDFTIKVGKLRGVESQGMMCSAKELQLAEDAEGLLILPADSVIGTPIGELFPADTILDLEITPNRADLLSHGGIAREVAALTGKKNSWPKWAAVEPTPEKPLTVAIETDSPCYYSALLICGVTIGPSPEWLRTKLDSVGARCINNAVDAGNYEMLLTGQPVHVFDAAKVHGTIRVREALPGETLLALDGRMYSLAPGDLVIADDSSVLAIAGIMGGQESSVTEATKDLILEIARFEPARIRRTARRLGLSTDSSYRYERGVDVVQTWLAFQFTGRLIAELTRATALYNPSSADTDPQLKLFRRKALPSIPLRVERVQAILGVSLPEERIDAILNGLGLVKSDAGWQSPTYRPDLAREIDLIEEVARVVGMDVIPARVQARIAAASPTDLAYDRAMTLRRALVAQGLHEARSLTLVPAEPRGLAFTQTVPESLLRVKNPMIDDQVVLRPGLLHGLLGALATNVRGGAASIRLFEIGRVFSAVGGAEETTHAALVLTGPNSERSWREAEGRDADLYDLKGILTATLGDGITFKPTENPALALSLTVEMNGQPIGFAGQLWPADARALDATAPIVFAEIGIELLDKARPENAAKKYREIPRFPAMTRDIALLAPLNLPHDAIVGALTGANEPLLASVELFDVFTDPTGAKVPAEQRSLAYSLTYRSTERTLTADEVNTAHAKLKERLKSSLAVALRE